MKDKRWLIIITPVYLQLCATG